MFFSKIINFRLSFIYTSWAIVIATTIAFINTAEAYASSGMLHITSNPPDSQIFINGEQKGNTPSVDGQYFSIRLPEDTYILKVLDIRTGHDVVKSIYVADNTIQPIHINIGTSKPRASEQDSSTESLTIDNLFTRKNAVRLEIGLDYATSEFSSFSTKNNVIQSSEGSLISVPTEIGESVTNSDVFVLSVGARYGITDDTEISLGLTGKVRNYRTEDINLNISSESAYQISLLSFGINHLFIDDDDSPALLGFAQLNAFENNALDGHDFSYLRSGTVGLTTYRTIDPLVLSLSAGYKLTRPRNVGGVQINPTDTFFLSPRIGFEVNNTVSLHGGTTIFYQTSPRLNGEAIFADRTSASLEFGVGYVVDKDFYLNGTVSTQLSGDGNAQFSINATYNFY